MQAYKNVQMQQNLDLKVERGLQYLAMRRKKIRAPKREQRFFKSANETDGYVKQIKILPNLIALK